MMQSENERQFYLGMAGVRLWYAREPLPGAAPSPEFIFAEAEEAEVSEPVASSGFPSARQSGAQERSDAGRQKIGAARVASLQALMDNPVPPETRPEPDRKEAVDAAAPEAEENGAPVGGDRTTTENEATPKLNLQLWVGHRLSLVASLTDEASLRLQETLAGNIMKSLGEPAVESVGPVRWPVFNNLRAPGNSRADLRAVLEHVLSGVHGQKVIALGADPAGGKADADWLLELSGTRADVTFPHTLAELASNPTLKRALWHEIKPLAGK